MPEEQVRGRARRFYRRIRGDQWQDEDRQLPLLTAFTLKDGEAGLSVFDVDIATPYLVLEHQLTLWTEIAARSEKDQRWVTKQWEKHGASVEELRAHGWGVAEVTEALFVRCGLQPSAEVEDNGHLEILGSKEAFEEKSLDIIDDPECRILSEEECLA